MKELPLRRQKNLKQLLQLDVFAVTTFDAATDNQENESNYRAFRHLHVFGSLLVRYLFLMGRK